MSASVNAENQSLKDQINMLQVQLKTANDEKQRHLEENSNEKVAYEAQVARLNLENHELKT